MSLWGCVLRGAAVWAALHLVAAASNISDMDRLYQDLFDNYIPTRPVVSWESYVSVQVDFSLYQIKALDGKLQLLETAGQLIMIWFDPKLSWDKEDYGGIGYMEVDARKIWTPVIGLRNSLGHAADTSWKSVFPCMINNTGVIAWAPTGSFESSCDLNMYKFPFDTQHCFLEFGNLVHVNISVILEPLANNVSLEFFLESKEFSLISTHVEITSQPTKIYLKEDYGISAIRFWITLERFPTHYLLNMIIPMVVMSLLSAFTFYVPVDSGEKLSLSITIMLSFSMFLLVLSESTPETSHPLPFIVTYLMSTICASAISIVVQMWTLNMYHKIYPGPVPPYLKTFTSFIAKPLGFGKIVSVKNPQKTGAIGNDAVDRVGTIADINNEVIMLSMCKLTDGTRRRADATEVQRTDGTEHSAVATEIKARDELCSDLNEEWRKVAFILDRFLFVVFLIFQCVAVFGFLLFLRFS